MNLKIIHHQTVNLNYTASDITIIMKIILYFAFYLIFLYTAKAQAPTNLQLLRGSNYNVAMIKSLEELRIPVVIPTTYKGLNLVVNLLDVTSVNGQVDNVNVAAFDNVQLEKDAQNKSFIKLSIKNEPILRPGGYMLRIQLKKKLESTEEELLESINLTITVLAATLHFPPSLSITRIYYGFFIEDKTLSSPFYIRETSGNANLSLVLRPRPLANAKGQLVDGIITTETDLNLNAGDERDLEPKYKTNSSIMGKVNGVYEFGAPQLANPVTLSVEVTNKFGWNFLVLTIIAGILAGYAVRTFLPERISINTERLKVLNLLKSLDLYLKIRPDTELQEEGKVLRDKLVNVMRTSDAQEIKNRVADYTTEFDTLKTNFENRKSSQQALLDTWGAVLHKNWLLPAEFSSLFQEANGSWALAMQSNANGNPKNSKRQLEEAQKVFTTALTSEGQKFRQVTEAALRVLQAPTTLKITEIQTLISDIQNQIGLLPEVWEPTEDKSVLEKMETINKKITDLRNEIGRALYNFLDTLVQLLQNGPALPVPKAIDDLLSIGKTVEKDLEGSSSQNLSILRWLPSQLQVLRTQLYEALLQQTMHIPANDLVAEQKRQLIRDDVNNGSLKAAVNQTLDFLKTYPFRQGAALTAQSFSPPATFNSVDHNSAWVLQTRQFQDQTEPPSTVDQLYEDTEREIIGFRRAEFYLISLLILIIGVLLWNQDFIGTVEDFAKVFFWAFSLDISLQVLTGLVTRVAGTPR